MQRCGPRHLSKLPRLRSLPAADTDPSQPTPTPPHTTVPLLRTRRLHDLCSLACLDLRPGPSLLRVPMFLPFLTCRTAARRSPRTASSPTAASAGGMSASPTGADGAPQGPPPSLPSPPASGTDDVAAAVAARRAERRARLLAQDPPSAPPPSLPSMASALTAGAAEAAFLQSPAPVLPPLPQPAVAAAVAAGLGAGAAAPDFLMSPAPEAPPDSDGSSLGGETGDGSDGSYDSDEFAYESSSRAALARAAAQKAAADGKQLWDYDLGYDPVDMPLAEALRNHEFRELDRVPQT